MESKRKDYINKILSEIMNLENSIYADNNMLDSIKNQGETPFVMAQINKVETRNNIKIIDIENLNIRLKHINMGHLDNEFLSEIQQNKIDQDTHKSYIINKRLEQSKIKEAKSKISQDFYKKTAQGDRETKWSVKNIEKTYQHFLRTNDSIPQYILRNLEDMPNNKGYIWKGIICLGELPEETKYPLTLFERQKGLLIIHEWTYTEYKIFHKKDKDKKVLFSSQIRKVMQDSTIEKSWIELSLPAEPLPIPQEIQHIPRVKNINQSYTRNYQQGPIQYGTIQNRPPHNGPVKHNGPIQHVPKDNRSPHHGPVKHNGPIQHGPKQNRSPHHGPLKQNGSIQNGATQNRAPHNGPTQHVPTQNRAPHNGPTQHVPTQNRAPHNGPTQNRAPHNGPTQNRAPHNGPTQHVPTQNNRNRQYKNKKYENLPI
jgi:hypothetical protein